MAPLKRRAGLALLALAALGCTVVLTRCKLRREELFLAQSNPPAGTLDRSGGPLLRVLVFGDFGFIGSQQTAVARAMVAEHRARGFDFGLMLGDNLYPCGPDLSLRGARDCAFNADGNTVDPDYQPPVDPQFRALFHGPLTELKLPSGEPLPIHAALGNHDIGYATACADGFNTPAADARAKACLEVAHREPGWAMPARHFVVDTPVSRFIVFDSNALAMDSYAFSFEAELAFVKEAIAGCGERRCFLAGHHMPVTAGTHRPSTLTESYRQRVRQLEEAGRIDAWLAGHDHDLQHLLTAKGYDVFISGSSAKDRAEQFGPESAPEARLHFGTPAWGFAVLEVFPAGWSMRFLDEQRAPLYCCESAGQSPCAPVACW